MLSITPRRGFLSNGCALASLLLTAWVLAEDSPLIVEQQPSVSGTAYALGDFRELYSEDYYLKDGTDSTQVIYREINGRDASAKRPFAVKAIDYSRSSSAPSYQFVDFRLGQLQAAERLRGEGSDVLLSSYVFAAEKSGFPELAGGEEFYRFAASSSETADTLNQASVDRSGAVSDSGLVTDAGFDNYIRQNWSQLVDSDRRLDFSFAVPSRAQAVAMRISPLSDSQCDRAALADIPEQMRVSAAELFCFKLVAKNWLVSQILKPIYLVYDDKKRLQYFRGLSNIRAADNGRLRVLIRYQYAQPASV